MTQQTSPQTVSAIAAFFAAASYTEIHADGTTGATAGRGPSVRPVSALGLGTAGIAPAGLLHFIAS